MKQYDNYKNELTNIINKIQESFTIKSGMISMLKTRFYIKQLVKLNRKTDNKNIDELIHVLGRTRYAYKKYCDENNYYPDSTVEKKIKESYIKLAKKSLKLKTRRKAIKNNKDDFEIEYNSNRGSYFVNYMKNNRVVKSKEYKVHNIKNLGKKRADILIRLNRQNFGINVFDELGLNDKNFYKVNPDIIHILLSEGKMDCAKMYIKEILDNEHLNKPFKIKYFLDKDINKGIFSAEENATMKIMAKNGNLAGDIVWLDNAKAQEISKPILKPLVRVRPAKNAEISKYGVYDEDEVLRRNKIVFYKIKRNKNMNKYVINETVNNDAIRDNTLNRELYNNNRQHNIKRYENQVEYDAR